MGRDERSHRWGAMNAATDEIRAGCDLGIRLLGPVGVDRAGVPLDLGGPKQRAVLAVLALRAGQTIDRDAILTAVWGDDVDVARARSLQTYVSSLRAVLDGAVVHHHGGYRLEVPPDAVDAVCFEHLVHEVRSSYLTDPVVAADRLRDGLSWWRGRPVADLDGAPGLEGDVRRLEQLRLDAVELRIEADLLCGRHEALVGELAALAAEHPLRERFRAQHMLALYRCGRQVEALRSYRDTVRYLADELGVEPTIELQRLEHAILSHDHDLLAGPFHATTQRLVILVYDVDGHVGRWERAPHALEAALTSFDATANEAVSAGQGRTVRTSNGRSATVFVDIEGAIATAEQLVRAASRERPDVAELLTVRVGIDQGEVELVGSALRGPAATRAGRLCAIAHGGQILLSAAASHELAASNPAGLQLRMLGEHEIHGFASPEQISQLVLTGLPAEFPELRRDLVEELGASIPHEVPGYELRGRLRETSLGVVWRAYQPSVGREVAITLVRPERTGTPSLAHNFDVAARSAARLAHPHILPVLDHWRDGGGAAVVSPLVDGGSLVDSRPAGAAAFRIVRQLGAALDYAHAHGVVHGAIVPANVLLDTAGNAYLGEVGVSRHCDGLVTPTAPELEYRAPEIDRTGPTPATDRYALAVIARSLVPSDDTTAPVLARATARGPDDRYPSATSFVADLSSALGRGVDGSDGDGSQGDTGSTPVRNPYKGLRAFDETDHADFYGRAAIVAELVAAVATEQMVTVVGASGSGKSSLVRAGLLPALGSGAIPGSDRWEHAVITPGFDPAEAVERALAACAGDVVLVIDQLEELYTLVDDVDSRQHFIDAVERALADAERSVRIVATLRADFFDRPLSDQRLGRLLTSAVITIIPPDTDELLEMVTAPAAAVGLRWEPGLALRIVRDAAAPGGLPLAQYALTELVERRRGNLLTSSDYVHIGCVAGAVATRAEVVFGELTEAERSSIRMVLLRLVSVDEDGASEVRRRVRRSELETLGLAGAELDHVLDAFVRERLLLADHDPVTRSPTIEVAHEALLEAWPRLRDWINTERAALIIGRRFRAAMSEWESSGRDAGYLLEGSRLAAFADWADSFRLSGAEREFHDACTRAEDRQHRARRRRRRIAGGMLAGVAVVTSALGIVALAQARRADDNAATALAERDRAESQTRVARARELTAAAVSSVGTDPGLAKLLSLAAVDAADATPETISVLRRAVAADRTVARHPWPDSIDRMAAVAISPDGAMVAYAGATVGDPEVDHLEVREVATWSLVWSAETRGYGADGIWFSPDSSRLVVGLSTWTDDDVPVGVRVFDARSGDVMKTHDIGRCGATVSDLTTTSAMLQVWPPANGSCTWEGVEPPLASLEIMDLDSGEAKVVEPEILDVRPRLSDDGRLAAFVIDGSQPTIVVEEISTGRRVAEIDPLALGIQGLLRELSPDGAHVAVGDDPIVVVDVATGDVVARFGEHATPPHSVVWDSRGASIWSVAADGNVFEWDPLDGTVLTSLLGQGGSGDLRASAGGGLLLLDDLNSRSMTIAAPHDASELWYVTGCAGSGTAPPHSVSVGAGAAAVQFECRDGLRTMLLDGIGATTESSASSNAPGIALSPTGTAIARYATTESGNTIVVEPTDSGETIVLSDSSSVDARWFEWSANGRIVLATGPDRIAAWDAATGAMLSNVEVCGFISDVAFAPTSDELVVGCFDEPWAVVSTTTWATIARPDPGAGHYPTFPGYSSDGSTLVVLNGGTGATSLLWLDADSFEVIERLDDVHTGAPTAWAMSPSGALAATASGDGLVKVWNVADRRQADELHLDDGVSGIGFMSDTMLLAATDRGVGASTLDSAELIRIARSSPTRAFTQAECERYAIVDC